MLIHLQTTDFESKVVTPNQKNNNLDMNETVIILTICDAGKKGRLRNNLHFFVSILLNIKSKSVTVCAKINEERRLS